MIRKTVQYCIFNIWQFYDAILMIFIVYKTLCLLFELKLISKHTELSNYQGRLRLIIWSNWQMSLRRNKGLGIQTKTTGQIDPVRIKDIQPRILIWLENAIK